MSGHVGQRVIVTGASRGIGRAIALGFVESGATVVCMARSAEGLSETLGMADSTGSGGSAISRVADVSDAEGFEAAIDSAISELGGADVLINNAAADHDSDIQSTSLATWMNVLNTNLTGAFVGCRAVAPYMLSQGSGCVLNVASIMGLVGAQNNSAYVSSKHGLIGLTRALALEWGKSGVRVNALAPGFVKTELTQDLWSNERGSAWVTKRTPMRRWGTVDEVVSAALFLASPSSTFLTGQVLTVDGGWTAQ